jgi:hypothetical protein
MPSLSWRDGSPDGTRVSSNTSSRFLVKCLRLHHMSAAFLTSVVSRSTYREECPYLVEACTNAFMYQSIASSLHLLTGFGHEDYLASSGADRARGVSRYVFRTEVELADCLKLEPEGNGISMRLGVADGYLLRLEARRASKDGGVPSLGFYLHVGRPSVITGAAGEGATIGRAGPMVGLHIKALKKESHMVCLFTNMWGFWNFFGKPWGEVVREGSPYFPQGRLTVKVTVRFISDRHEEWCSEPSSEEDADEESEGED